MVIRTVSRAWLFSSLYHPLILHHDSFIKGGSEARRLSISDPDVSDHFQRSACMIALICHPRQGGSCWYWVGSWQTETIFSTRLHMDTNIHKFTLPYRAIRLVTGMQISANIRSYLVGISSGHKGGRLLRPSYCECTSVDLQRHPRII